MGPTGMPVLPWPAELLQLAFLATQCGLAVGGNSCEAPSWEDRLRNLTGGSALGAVASWTLGSSGCWGWGADLETLLVLMLATWPRKQLRIFLQHRASQEGQVVMSSTLRGLC